MLGGLQRTPESISVSGLPVGSFIIFPNASDSGKWYSKDWQGNVEPLGSLNPVIGADRSFQRRTDQVNESGTAQVTYLTLNISNSGASPVTHELIVQYTWGYGSAATDFVGEIRQDGNLLVDGHRQEPKDGGADQRMSYMMMDEIIIPPGGSTVVLSFASSSSGNQARMYSARMRSQRVA